MTNAAHTNQMQFTTIVIHDGIGVYWPLFVFLFMVLLPFIIALRCFLLRDKRPEEAIRTARRSFLGLHLVFASSVSSLDSAIPQRVDFLQETLPSSFSSLLRHREYLYVAFSAGHCHPMPRINGLCGLDCCRSWSASSSVAAEIHHYINRLMRSCPDDFVLFVLDG